MVEELTILYLPKIWPKCWKTLGSWRYAKRDNIVIRSATVDEVIQLNKWRNDGKVMKHAGFPNRPGEL